MTLPSWIAWPGGLPCPWTRGTVDTEACARPPGASDGANEVGPTGSGYRPVVGSGAGLVGGVLAAWGSGMPGIVRPDPSTLGAVGERGSHRESCLQLVPGNDGDWLTRYGRLMTLTGWAAGYAEELLAPLGDRWAHVQGVVRQAQDVSAILPAEEREDLVAAAYLHDLGYAPALVETGFHALDGARHLRALGYERLAGLVAYHSGARCEAELRGLTAQLAEFADEASATSMTLTYCDMTTGPAGEVITYEERLAGVERRYGVEHVVARSVRHARAEVERSTAFVEGRMREVAAS
jgi:hypothetical protein